MTAQPTAANDQLIKNLQNQVDRLVEQLADVEECKYEKLKTSNDSHRNAGQSDSLQNPFRSDLTPDEYAQMKEDALEEIRDFTARLDRMTKGDVTLNSEFSRMRQSIRTAIATASIACEARKMFVNQSVQELEAQLVALDESLKLRRVDEAKHASDKVALLLHLKECCGRQMSADEERFIDAWNERTCPRMEQLEDDGADEAIVSA